jgi:hypothetical protein
VPVVRQAYELPTDAEAHAMIDRVDQERGRFLRAMCGCSMSDSRNYDLTINTATLGLDHAEEMVVRVVEAARKGGADAGAARAPASDHR